MHVYSAINCSKKYSYNCVPPHSWNSRIIFSYTYYIMFIFLSFVVAASLITLHVLSRNNYNTKCSTIIWIHTWTLYINICLVCNIYCLVSSLRFTRFRLVRNSTFQNIVLSYSLERKTSKRAVFLGVDFLFSALNRPTAILACRSAIFDWWRVGRLNNYHHPWGVFLTIYFYRIIQFSN